MSILLYRTVETTVEALQGVVKARLGDSTATLNLKKANSCRHHHLIQVPHGDSTAATRSAARPSMVEAAAALMHTAGVMAKVLWAPHTLLIAVMQQQRPQAMTTADKEGQQSVLAHCSSETAVETGRRAPVAVMSQHTTRQAGTLQRLEAAADTQT
jgi:hypothetical protein